MGFILRVAELNSLPARMLIASLGACTPGKCQSPARLIQTATTLGVPVERWTSYQEDPTGYDLVARGEMWGADLRLWRPFLAWYCPECLKVSGMLRGEWQFPLLPVCVEHGCFLISQCPQCTCDLTARFRVWLTKCNCEFELCEAASERLNDEEIALARLILARFAKTEKAGDHPLSGLRLAPLLRMVRFAGLETASSEVRLAGRIPFTLEESKSWFRRAAHNLRDWPPSFTEMLDRLVGRADVPSKVFIARFLSVRFQGDAGRPVRMAFRRWFKGNRVASSVESVSTASLTNLDQLGGVLNIDPRILRRHAGQLSMPLVSEGSRKASHVSATDAKLLFEHVEKRGQPPGYLRPWQAGNRLGLRGLTQLVEAARDGLVRFQLHTNYVFFLEEDVDRLIAQLRPARLVNALDGEVISLLERDFSFGGVTLERLVNGCQKGDFEILQRFHAADYALRNFVVRSDDFRRLLAPGSNWRRTGHVITPRIITIKACVELIRLLFPEGAKGAAPAVIWHSRYAGLTFES